MRCGDDPTSLMDGRVTARLYPGPGQRDPLPPLVRRAVAALLAWRNECPEEQLDQIDRTIVMLATPAAGWGR